MLQGGGEGLNHPPRSAYPPANHTKPVAWVLPANQTQNFRRPLLPAIFVGKAHATIHTYKTKGRLKTLFRRPYGRLGFKTQHFKLSKVRWVSTQPTPC